MTTGHEPGPRAKHQEARPDTGRMRHGAALFTLHTIACALVAVAVFVFIFPEHFKRLRSGEISLPGGGFPTDFADYATDGEGDVSPEVLKRLHRQMTLSRWPLGTYRWHEQIGYELTPGFSATLLDGSFTTRTHELGYRIPLSESMTSIEPGGVLSVGCSFTYADFVEAEESFSFRAGRTLGVPSYNYGVPSYSYASAVLQLEDLDRRGVLRRLRPSALVLGANSWLHDRSRTPYLPTNGLQYAYSYIAKEKGRVLVKQPPSELSLKHQFELSELYFPKGRRDFELTPRRRELLAEVAPVVLAATEARSRWRSDVSVEEVYELTISRLAKVAQAWRVPLVVLWLSCDPHEHPPPELVRVVAGQDAVSLVDGARALEGLSVEAVTRVFHPTALAHRRFGDLLAEELTKRWRPARPRPTPTPQASSPATAVPPNHLQ